MYFFRTYQTVLAVLLFALKFVINSGNTFICSISLVKVFTLSLLIYTYYILIYQKTCYIVVYTVYIVNMTNI